MRSMMGKVRAFAPLVLFLAALFLSLAPALAYDESVVSQSQLAAEVFRTELRRVGDELQSPAVTAEQLTEHRRALEDIRAGALTQSATLDGPIAEVTQQLAGLGAPPDPPAEESLAIATQRKSLSENLVRLQGIKAQIDLVAVEAEQLSNRASSIQRQQFFQRIFQGGPTILKPDLWIDAAKGFGLLATKLTAIAFTWAREARASASATLLGLVPIYLAILLAAYALLRRRVEGWFRLHHAAKRQPDEMDRLWRVLHAGIGTTFILSVVFAPVIALIEAGGFMTGGIELVIYAILNITVPTLLLGVLARRIAAPGQPEWRIVNLDDRAAARFSTFATLIAFLSAVSVTVGAVPDRLFVPVNYTIGQSAVLALVMLAAQSALLVALRNQPGLVPRTPGRKFYFTWASRLHPLLWIAVLTGIVALLAGYVALAAYIAQRIFDTTLIVGGLFFLHHLSDAAVAASLDPLSVFGRFLRRLTGLGERGIERLGLLFRTVIDLFLILAGLPLLFLQWTLTWVDFRSLANTAFYGFKVGDVSLSLSTVLLVIAVFVAGIVVTNLVIRWLDRRILNETRIDKGVQDSVRKGATYAGYILAAGFAFSAAGLEFANLAFIAGALGVGIGFGLQSIVNNFVSGLILLAERPVRVGDWVVLNAGEGIVKRINVRSTEIETFDSLTIIVPNTMLVAEAVRNWTHGDNIGRFGVNLTVAYGSDAEAVRDILVTLTRAHPKVLTYPEPVVLLARYGPVGLDFEIKAHVADVFEGGLVASDLRYAILKAFAEKNIAIPVSNMVIAAR